MASLTLDMVEIQHGYYCTFFFQTQAFYGYTVSIPGTDVKWTKPKEQSGQPRSSVGHFVWKGNTGDLQVVIDCPQSNKLSHGFNANAIITPTGNLVLGYSYVADVDDGGGNVDYNDLYINLVGWKYYG